MEQFTASEVRRTAAAIEGKQMLVSSMLRAFADLLEAQEKAVPVMIVNHVSSAEHDLPIGMKLYTHPSPSDAERLAEALERTARHRAAADRIDPDQWRSVLYSWEDRALAANSAQAQPPAASVTDAMVERGLEACIQDSDARLSRYKVVRSIIEAALAAQENPNG